MLRSEVTGVLHEETLVSYLHMRAPLAVVFVVESSFQEDLQTMVVMCVQKGKLTGAGIGEDCHR
jgi:hypothetical protein